MAEQVKSYSIGFHFRSNLAELRRIRTQLDDFRRLQLRHTVQDSRDELRNDQETERNRKILYTNASNERRKLNKSDLDYNHGIITEKYRAELSQQQQSLSASKSYFADLMREEESYYNKLRMDATSSLINDKTTMKASKTAFADMLKEEEKAAKAQTAKLKELRKQAQAEELRMIGDIKAATAKLTTAEHSVKNPAAKTALAEQLKKEAAQAEELEAILHRVNSERARVAANRISNPRNDASIANYKGLIEQLEAEQRAAAETEARLAKVRNAAIKAQVDSLVNNRTVQEEYEYAQLVKDMEEQAQEAAQLARIEEKRVKSLEKAKAIILSTIYMRKQATSAAEAEMQANIKKRLDAEAKTAADVKEIVAEERGSLATSRERTKQLERQNYLMSRMNISAKQLVGSFVSAFAIYAGGKAVMNAALQMQSFRVAMDTVSGSAEMGAKNFEWLRQEAYHLGLDLKGAAHGFSMILAAGQGKYSLKQMRDIFSSVAEAATSMHLSQEDVNGTILAIQQMMSKGKVQAQELRLQLGNRLSPAFRLMAAGLNLTTQQLDKMMQQGQILSADALPKFARQLHNFAKGGLNRALDSWVVALGRFKFAMTDAADQMVNSTNLGPELDKFFESLQKLIEDNMPLWRTLGRIIAGTLHIITFGIKVTDHILQSLGDMLEWVTKLIGNWTAVVGIAFGIGTIAKISGVTLAFKRLAAAETLAFDGAKAKSFFGVLGSGLKFLALRLLPLTIAFAAIEELYNAFVGHNKIGLLYDPTQPEGKRYLWQRMQADNPKDDPHKHKAVDTALGNIPFFGQLYSAGESMFGNLQGMYANSPAKSNPISEQQMQAAQMAAMGGTAGIVPAVNLEIHNYIDGDEVASRVTTKQQFKDTMKETFNNQIGD